jgi:hypothetical protein
MNFGLKPLTLCVGLCITSIFAVAQGTTCATDGDAPAQGAPIACVTGEGVRVTANTPVTTESDILPLTPEQRPAAPPLVIYHDGKLSVNANNSTLGDVLRAIATKTGAAIEIPDNASERVVSQLGPAPARDVVAALLNGSHFNYVVVGTEADPNAVVRVVLTAKSERSEPNMIGHGPTTATVSGRPMVQPRSALQAAVMAPYQEMVRQQEELQAGTLELPTPPEPVAEAPAASNNVAPANAGSATPNPAQTPGAVSNAPAENHSAEPTPTAETPKAGNDNGEKTPQQRLQDLYETRKQMMIQQQKAAAGQNQ